MAKIKRLSNRYIRVDRVSRTVAVMDKKTGRLKGRVGIKGRYFKVGNKNVYVSPSSVIGDTTHLRHTTKPLDLDNDGKIDIPAGGSIGRTNKVLVKGSRRNKSYVRRI